MRIPRATTKMPPKRSSSDPTALRVCVQLTHLRRQVSMSGAASAARAEYGQQQQSKAKVTPPQHG